MWNRTRAFGFTPDIDKAARVATPIPAWAPRSASLPPALTAAAIEHFAVREEGQTEAAAAFAAAAAAVLYAYHRCEGDDAVLVVSNAGVAPGLPPTALLNPFAGKAGTAFNLRDATAAVLAALAGAASADAEARVALASRLRDAAKSAGRQQVGSGAVVTAAEAAALGDAALVEAFDVVWVVDGGAVRLLYNAQLFVAASADVWLDVLGAIGDTTADPFTSPSASLGAVTPAMRTKLLQDWQSGLIPPAEYARTLSDIFVESAVRRAGDAEQQLAVMDPVHGLTYTYAAMLRRARKVAMFLHRRIPHVGDAGRWGRDATCGIHIPRGADWYVLMLGVHLAGGAYLSLDPDFPADRLLFALEDSDAVVLFTLAKTKDALGFRGETVCIDEAWAQIDAIADEDAAAFVSPATPESPCYLIYTSGSTGKPKGVLIEHRNAVNFVLSEVRLFKLNNRHRVLQGFSTSFDASVEEIWLAFASGSTLVVVPKAVMQDVEALGQLVQATQATVLSTVPTLLATIDPDVLSSLQMVIAGAEACSREVVQAYATGGRRVFVNSYGPTEATVACMADFSSPDRPVTIGRPQPGYFACILNERGELLPPGVPGELCIAGPSVARGYVNRPDLTAEKFVECPFFSDLGTDDELYRRMYHTGDLTRWNSEGRVEFLGRIDSQVKLRGFRIEVGEIETHVSKYEGVKTAIVHLVKEEATGQQYLCGYLLCDRFLEANLDEGALKEFLKDKLPHYMVPTRFCTISEVPRSPAGKLDRKQLKPPPPPKRKTGAEGPRQPRNATEEELHELWSTLFPGQAVGITDSFFDLGGHSLLAGKAASKIRVMGYPDFGIRQLYTNPTIESLAPVLQDMKVNAPAPPCPSLPVRFEPSCLRKAVFTAVQLVVMTYALVMQWAYLLLYFMLIYNNYGDTFAQWCGGRGPSFFIINGVFLQGAFIVFAFINSLLVCPLWKWLLVGRVRPGLHSIWSIYYLRWWTVRAIANPSGSLMMHGTYVYTAYLRLFGASLGSNVCLNSPVSDPDLLTIGDDAFVGDNAVLGTSEVIDGILHLRKVTIGAAASIGARCALRGDTTVGAGAVLKPLTLLREGTVVGPGELWAGSPGKKISTAATLAEILPDTASTADSRQSAAPSSAADLEGHLQQPLMSDVPAVHATHPPGHSDAVRPSLPMRLVFATVQYVFFFVTALVASNPIGIITFAAWLLCDYLQDRDKLYYAALYLVIAPVFTAVIMVYQHCLLAGLRWIVFPWSVSPGAYPSTGTLFQRKLLVDMIARFSLTFAHPMYGSIFTQYWLRMMGCKVGCRVECSNLFGFTPGLTEFGDESFVADFVGVNPPDVHRGVLMLDHVRVGERAFVGNGAVLPSGSELEPRSLLGLTSLCPDRVPAGSTMIGSPAFDIPRRNSADSVAQQHTFQPSCMLVARRVVWETFRCVMPACFTAYSALVAYILVAVLYREEKTLFKRSMADLKVEIFVVLGLLFVWLVAFWNVFFVLFVKWVIIGRHIPEENPLWSPAVWRAEFVVDTTTVIGLAGVLGMMRGTIMLPLFFRLMGAKVGKNVFLDTLFLTEPDMVTLGDGVSVNFNATLQTHLFEDRIMKIDRQRIDDRCSVGPYGVVLYNTHIGEGCTVAPQSLVMKGESYPPRTHWEGIPAARRPPPAVMEVPTDSPAPQRVAKGKSAPAAASPQCPAVTSLPAATGGSHGRAIASWLRADE